MEKEISFWVINSVAIIALWMGILGILSFLRIRSCRRKIVSLEQKIENYLNEPVTVSTITPNYYPQGLLLLKQGEVYRLLDMHPNDKTIHYITKKGKKLPHPHGIISLKKIIGNNLRTLVIKSWGTLRTKREILNTFNYTLINPI